MRYEAVGKPLGGAKKYRWKSSGLTLEDLDELNLKEKYQFVKKNNIWKKPNYEELVASGLPIRVAYYMKKFEIRYLLNRLFLIMRQRMKLKKYVKTTPAL